MSTTDAGAFGCLLLGALLCLTAGLGLLRFPDVLARMHAGTKPQVLGVLLVTVGAAIRLAGSPATWMLALVVAFQLITAPLSAHMISRIAYRRRHVRRDLLVVDEYASAHAEERADAGGPQGDEPADAAADRPGAA